MKDTSEFNNKNATITATQKREKAGVLSSIIGVIVNLLLALFKFLVGQMTGSMGLLADAANNLSDTGNSVVSLLSFHYAAKPADCDHPYGHARLEYLTSSIAGLLILMLSFRLIWDSIWAIIKPELPNSNIYSYIVLGIAIGVKLVLFVFNRRLGIKVNSELLRAVAFDSLSDVMATSAVLVSTLLAPVLPSVPLDGITGLIVAGFIFYAGFSIVKSSLNKILGEAPEGDLVTEITQKILAYEGILGVHDLMIHEYGPDRFFASAHVEVDARRTLIDSHDCLDLIERELGMDLGIHLVLHLDPIVLDDPILEYERTRLAELIKTVDSELTLHDFRLVKGTTHQNFVFDVLAPTSCALSDRQIRECIDKAVKSVNPNDYAVVTVDRAYIGMPSPLPSKT